MGAAGAPPPPQRDPILLLSHVFSPKSVRVKGRRPPPPQRKILDPPLQCATNTVTIKSNAAFRSRDIFIEDYFTLHIFILTIENDLEEGVIYIPLLQSLSEDKEFLGL